MAKNNRRNDIDHPWYSDVRVYHMNKRNNNKFPGEAVYEDGPDNHLQDDSSLEIDNLIERLEKITD